MMKRIFALFLCCALLSGCTAPYAAPPQTTAPAATQPETTVPTNPTTETSPVIQTEPEPEEITLDVLEPGALTTLEEQIYAELVLQLDSTDYFVDHVEVTYISNEYLEELEFNSQANIYFGYTLEQLNEFFEGKQFIFTLGEDGQTVVQELVQQENHFSEIVKNLAIGGGVILVSAVVICAIGPEAVTFSTVMGCAVDLGTGPTVKFIGSVLRSVIANRNAENLGQLVQETALAGSENFKWGVLGGSLKKAAGTAFSLLSQPSNGLSAEECAQIQQESGLPLDFIKNFHSMEEYRVYRDAGLEGQKVDGQWAFTRDIDWDFLDDQGRTNAQRVREGLSPLDPWGESYELHHIGQRTDSPLAILTSREHEDFFSALHSNTGETEGEQPSQGSEWTQQRRNFWKTLLDMYLKNAA